VFFLEITEWEPWSLRVPSGVASQQIWGGQIFWL